MLRKASPSSIMLPQRSKKTSRNDDLVNRIDRNGFEIASLYSRYKRIGKRRYVTSPGNKLNRCSEYVRYGKGSCDMKTRNSMPSPKD
jgi:hypothetical protein